MICFCPVMLCVDGLCGMRCYGVAGVGSLFCVHVGFMGVGTWQELCGKGIILFVCVFVIHVVKKIKVF